MGKVEEIQRIANRFTLRRFWGRHVTKKCVMHQRPATGDLMDRYGRNSLMGIGLYARLLVLDPALSGLVKFSLQLAADDSSGAG